MLRRALAPAAVLLLVTACSGRANNLYTYYDDPTTEGTTAPAELTGGQAAPAAVTTTTTPPVATTTSAAPSVDAASALLGPQDLAGEGVESASYSSDAAPACAPETGASWAYPSGSTMEQTVHVLPDAAERIVEMRAAGTCVGEPGSTLSDGPELGELGDDRYSWCVVAAADPGCGAAVAKDGLLTVIVVKAASTDRAGAAITRIAPLAAAALDRE
ncbi:hypothetical protein ACTG9Q_25050 [Actinokineospora sp. 24-640]